MTGMADYWVCCWVKTNENYLNCHKFPKGGVGMRVREGSILTWVDISNILIWVWGHR